jgi:hypothetical protein
MTRVNYTPARGSLAEQVVAHCKKYPTDEIAADDMFESFNVPRHTNIRMALVDAYTTDLLARRESAGEHYYKAGKRLLGKLAKSRPGRPAATKSTTTDSEAAPPARVMDFPDPLTVPIDDDVPCISHRAAVPVCWLPLLARLTKPLQSAALPIKCKATLSKSITQAHKASDAKYRTKLDKAAGTVRVWRVA